MQVIEAAPLSGLPHLHSILHKSLDPVLSSLLHRLQTGDTDNLTREGVEPVLALALDAITVSTSAGALQQQFPALDLQQAEQVAELARKFQVHTCTASCKEIFAPGQLCRHYFPREPSLLPLVALRPSMATDEDRVILSSFERIKERVQKLLRLLPSHPLPAEEEDPVASLLNLLHQVADPPVARDGGGYSWAGATFCPGLQLDRLLQEFGVLTVSQEDAVLLAVYHSSVLCRRQSKFVPLRRVSEVWVVNFNPWAIQAIQGNMELDIITHTPQKLISYVGKGVSQRSLQTAKEELYDREQSGDVETAERLEELGKAGWREVSLVEALFRLDSNLTLSQCTLKVTWLNTNLEKLVQPGGVSGYILPYILR